MPSAPSQLEKALGLHRAGNLASAAALYEEILRATPNQPDALNLLGLVLHAQGKHGQAANLFERAIAANAKNPAVLVNWGNSLRALGEPQKAMDVFKRALALDAHHAEAHHQLGNCLKGLGRFQEAEISLRRAADLNPGSAVIQLNFGVALLELGRRPEAIRCFEQAVQREPAMPEAYNILGAALVDAGRLGEAKRMLGEALRLRPGYSAARDNLGRALRAQGRAAEALEEFRAAMVGKPAPATHSNLVYALNFVPGLEPAEIFQEHKNWAHLHAEPVKRSSSPQHEAFDPDRRLRIGYVSPDFVHHAVSYFIEPILQRHDRSRFEVFCYSNAPVSDAVTARLKSHADHWREIALLGDERVAELIIRDKIDLLIDLAGHTARNRLLLLARKPAPLQLTWLGYPNTTGLETIDYRITDAVCDPPGATEAFHSEKLVRLPDGFCCYRPSAQAPAVEPPPAVKNGYVTFGSFNHFAKINPAVLDLWAKLLVRLPTARLFLKARSLADAETARGVVETLAGLGVGPDRVMLRSDESSVAEHLGLYREMDVALDPFPYNGTTTTCEALWMGVPVVTLAGRTHVSRVSASLLTSLGRSEWIADTTDEYLEKCVALAMSTTGLAEMRAAQRERMRLSPICNETNFTAQFEAACRDLWRKRCDAENQSGGSP